MTGTVEHSPYDPIEDLDAVDELAGSATDEADRKVLAEWEQEAAEDARKHALAEIAMSGPMPELVARQDGTVVPKDVIERERAAGQDDSGPYGRGSRA